MVRATETDSSSPGETCRELTLHDVQQALFPLTPQSELSSSMKSRCCALLRLDRRSSRLLLPLARRSRTDFSQHPSVTLCSKCHQIKEQQFLHLRRELDFPLISVDEQSHLTTDANYSPTAEKLVWNLNSADPSFIHDTGSLTEEEKKALLQQTLKTLQQILLDQSSSITDDDHQSMVCHTLRRTIETLSSSIPSNRDENDQNRSTF